MGSVYLIRHGQASFGKADYDALSEKGHQQSRLLGEHLRARITPTRLISGAMTRHKETYTGFRNGYIDCARDSSIQDSSTPLPELEIDAGFNEFDHVEVMVRHRPEWADQRVMAQELAKSKVPRKVFQHEFETAIARWACGDFDGEYQESWPQFQARVIASLNQVLSTAERSQDILIFTSGG
ncbi:MAG: phosphoglycerate mutase family protein, partial [Pseudomonadales bacterium]|nr:phosphoglycerate mutase family protein [Pseudomonadales bacterium]